MLNKTIRILNFDDSIIKQPGLILDYRPQIIDLKDLGPAVRLWLDNETKKVIQERIGASEKNSITFLGSGDFHHISHLLISQFEGPLSVIIFDSHPDWDTLPPHLGCGSWVSSILKNKNILKIILVGISSNDISSFWIHSGNLGSLKDDRVEIYPYSHLPSKVFFKKITPNLSTRIERGLIFNRIYWNELKDKDLGNFFLSLVKRLPTKEVYISVDKDCLNKESALTNWEEGLLKLDELLLMLKLIKENRDIVGMDIAGDYSKIAVAGAVKAILSGLDHPKKIRADRLPESVINATNEATNLKILQVLQSL